MPQIIKAILLLIFFPCILVAQVNIDSLQKELKIFTHDSSRCNYLNTLIEDEGNEQIWRLYNEELHRICELNLKKINLNHPLHKFYTKHLAGAFNNSAYLQQQQGKTTEAKLLFERSLKLREHVGDKAGIAESLNNIGVIYQNQGDIPKTLECYLQSLKIYEELNDKAGKALCLNNIGSIYKHLREPEKALRNFQESLRLHEELQDKSGQAYALSNIGNLYFNTGDYKNALEFLFKTLKLSESINDKGSQSLALNHIAAIYQKNTRSHEDTSLKLALEFNKRAISVQKQINDKKGLAFSYNSIGTILMQQKKTDQALSYALLSLKLSQELGYPQMISYASSLVATLKAKKGDYKTAYEMHVLFKRMTDSLNNEEVRKNGIQKDLQYQYEKKASADSIRAAEVKKVSEAKLKESHALLKQEKTQRFALYGGIVLVLVFAGIFYNRFKLTERQKKIIEKKEQETQKQNEIITHQKALVEGKQKEIVDSINYAKRIQYSLLPGESFLSQNLHDHFVYFQPKDIVSGDFYWATEVQAEKNIESDVLKNLFYLAVCDSTGHGVPGAFMSILNIGYLSEAIKEKEIASPNEVFNYVRQRLTTSISKEGQKDGFDGVLVCFDPTTNMLRYAAANNAPILIRNGSFVNLSNNRMPVGIGENEYSFELFEFEKQNGDMLYLYTDGFADQFGGPKGKKFKYRQLNDLLLQIHHHPLTEQKNIMIREFNSWRGELEQVDDVCVVGIRF
jgi:serine phosphatase RsbU (regulator of sigma subunit)